MINIQKMKMAEQYFKVDQKIIILKPISNFQINQKINIKNIEPMIWRYRPMMK